MVALTLRFHLVVLLCMTMAVPPGSAATLSDDVVKIGIMNDQSGAYSDNCGPGAVAAARLAIEDFGGAISGKDIKLVVADDQNKPDVGVAIALRWLDSEGVDVIVGCSASSIALAVQDITRERKKPYMIAGTALSALTDERCSPMTVQWMQDSYSLSKATVKALLAQGLDTWFFITVDYTFGKTLQADTARFLTAGGGKVVGSVLHPLNAHDFSTYLLQAQASGAKVVALANSGADLANSLKQAEEFGLMTSGAQKIAPLSLDVNAVYSIGLQALQGAELTTSFYWDMTDETRAFAKRFQIAFGGRIPNKFQAATYNAVSHYLRSVALAGTDDGEAVMKMMRETPVNDFDLKNVSIRADGQVLRPIYSARIKAPAQSKYPFDYYEITGTVPPDGIWRPASESRCDLLKK